MKLPMYVKVDKTVFRRVTKESGFWANEKNVWYYKYAGEWGFDYKIVNGKLFANCPDIKSLHGKELITTNRSEWLKDNKGYTS